LEKNGFILRKHDSNDERITILEITPKGRQVIENIQAAHDNNIANYLEGFTQDDKKELLESLKQLFNNSPLK
jgi:DNA-binding MarR family transcriptional regulator